MPLLTDANYVNFHNCNPVRNYNFRKNNSADINLLTEWMFPCFLFLLLLIINITKLIWKDRLDLMLLRGRCI
jgi:hypothetical protein